MMNTAHVYNFSLVLAVAIILSGYVNPALAGKKCDEDPTHPSCASDGGGDAGGVTTATFGDAPDALANDGDGPYIDGVDKVSLGIGKEGNFGMHLTKGNQLAIRTVALDFSVCSIPPCNPPFPSPFVGFSVGPVYLHTSGVDLIHNADYPANLGLEAVINLDQIGLGLWDLYFDSSKAQCPNSADAMVTKAADNTWVITGQTACLTQKSERGGAETPSGVYYMPFVLTVQTN